MEERLKNFWQIIIFIFHALCVIGTIAAFVLIAFLALTVNATIWLKRIFKKHIMTYEFWGPTAMILPFFGFALILMSALIKYRSSIWLCVIGFLMIMISGVIILTLSVLRKLQQGKTLSSPSLEK